MSVLLLRLRDYVIVPEREERKSFRLSRTFDSPARYSKRVLEVHRAFGIGIGRREHVIYRDLVLDVDPGDVVYVTGESGGGKSLILKDLERELQRHEEFKPVLNMDSVEVDPNERVIEGVGRDVAEAIELLSFVGLGEAYLFLRRYRELSDGQKFRYRVAKALDLKPRTLIVDEFCSNLDRVTARVLAFLTQRWCRKRGMTLVAASAHDDLVEDLGPDVLVIKRFGSNAEVRYDLPRPERCSLLRSLKIEKGSAEDYRALSEFHYRGRNPGHVKAVYRAMIGDELAGVIVYSYPHPNLRARNAALPFLRELIRSGMRSYLKWLNEHFVRISRVIVHPKFRGIGVAVELVRHTMPLEGRPYVETLAVMAKYNPFFERAGMVRVSGPSDVRMERLNRAYKELRSLGATERILLDSELFRHWFESLNRRKRRRALNALSSVGDYWRRSGSRKLDPERAAKALVSLLNPPEYLIWKNPDPIYAGFPDPQVSLTGRPSQGSSS
ncbi:MAG: ATP-binding cassette domain-containing protein [Nitrososphaerota archaeon]